jgi:hypothetical protein
MIWLMVWSTVRFRDDPVLARVVPTFWFVMLLG